MATFHVFAGALRPGQPGTQDGIVFYYPVYADIVVLDESDEAIMPGDSPDTWTGYVTIGSSEPMEISDDMAAMRRKVLAGLREIYPQIDIADTIVTHWLDSPDLT